MTPQTEDLPPPPSPGVVGEEDAYVYDDTDRVRSNSRNL